MTTKALEAWVLHKKPSGDSSLRLTFFTRKMGIVECLYKGGRTPKKQAVLQPFQSLWLNLNVHRDWYFVRHIEIIKNTIPLKGNALFAGFYVNELLYYALKPQDPQPELFNAYVQVMQGLSAISERLAIEILLRRFEWILLKACGYSLKPQNGFKQEHYYQLIAGEGFVKAEAGFSGKDIIELAEGRLETLSVLKSAKLIMRQAIDHLLNGRVLKSRSLFLAKSDKLACKSLS
ncbi:MAG: DNA repair protein RecO [Tatlockia sp.]|nr:DNA repair protein RecO [Tatlockia sp.]